MSIASAITSLQSRVADAYTSVGNKGGTLPATQDTLHLPAAIASIPQSGGSSSKFGATIEQVFDTVTEDDETTLNMFGGCTNLTFTGVTKITGFGMAYKFYRSSVTSVSFPALTSAVGDSTFKSAFQNCTSLTSVSFPELPSVNGGSFGNTFASAFQNCTSLTSVSFPKLTSVYSSGPDGTFPSAFCGCTSLTSISFPELTSITNGNNANPTSGSFYFAFSGCTSLTTVSFPKLASITGSNAFSRAFQSSRLHSLSFPALTSIVANSTNATTSVFYQNTTLTRIDFPVLTTMKKTASATSNNLTYIFSNCTGLTELHFGSANQAVIEASDGYATKWGAPNANCTIYFDL